MGCFSCFDGGGASKQRRKEEEQLASQEARAKAAEAAQKRQEQFEQSAAGRAARAQQAAIAKQSANTNKGEPVLKMSYVAEDLNEILEFDLLLLHFVDAVADGMRFYSLNLSLTPHVFIKAENN